MLKLHDELIEELAKLLMEQNYNPVVVTNHRLYARRFLDYLAERDMPVAMVTPAQVDQYFRHAVHCFHGRYGRPPSSRWHRLPNTAIGRLLRLAQGTWPPEAEIEPGKMLRHAICHDYETWMRDERGLSDATIDARLREAQRFLDWYCDRSGADGLQGLAIHGRARGRTAPNIARGICRVASVPAALSPSVGASTDRSERAGHRPHALCL
jgi:hypothetical protein